MGKPKQLYSDGESSLRARDFFRFSNEHNIKHIQTSTHAPTVENIIRIFKMNLYRRLDGSNQDKNEWVKLVKHIVDTNSNTVHSTIEAKPNEAKLSHNHLWVNWHLQNSSKKNRTYEEIQEGDTVRVNIKKGKFSKSHEPNWSSTRHKIVGVRGNRYFIPSINKQNKIKT